MKIVCMIPARLGSKRVKNKNLRFLGGKPLVCHVVEAVKATEIFDEIYVNSEGEVFKNFADEYGVKFYKRPQALAEDDASNDQLVEDFFNHVECDVIIQVNPTSPFFTVEDIKSFVKEMMDHDYDAMHGMVEQKIETVFKSKEVNFDFCKKMPKSQDLEPILTHAGGLMGWKKDKYFENLKNFGSATYGGDGKIGFYVLRGFSCVDIDTEDDFTFAEVVMEYLCKKKEHKKEYYQE